MKDILVRAGSGLLAAAVGYIGLNVFAEGLGQPLKVVAAIAIGACAFGIAVWAAGGSAKDTGRAAQVASNLKGTNIHIEDVRADASSGQNVKVASDINAQGSIEIKRAGIDSARNQN